MIGSARRSEPSKRRSDDTRHLDAHHAAQNDVTRPVLIAIHALRTHIGNRQASKRRDPGSVGLHGHRGREACDVNDMGRRKGLKIATRAERTKRHRLASGDRSRATNRRLEQRFNGVGGGIAQADAQRRARECGVA